VQNGLVNPEPPWVSFPALGKTVPAAAASTEPSFEEALKKLESVVEAMESGDLPLEQLLARFEEGAGLVKLCQDRLGAAELRIQVLEKTLDGLQAKPFTPGGAA
jgi:exodeoxyribonuclease VII small subunit